MATLLNKKGFAFIPILLLCNVWIFQISHLLKSQINSYQNLDHLQKNQRCYQLSLACYEQLPQLFAKIPYDPLELSIQFEKIATITLTKDKKYIQIKCRLKDKSQHRYRVPYIQNKQNLSFQKLKKI